MNYEVNMNKAATNKAASGNEVEFSQAFLRKRKMLLMLPVLVLPFITMAFWALGGGEGKDSNLIVDQKQGLNLNLPNAVTVKEKSSDKLSFYESARKDSLKRAEFIRNDPYYHQLHPETEVEGLINSMALQYKQPLNMSSVATETEVAEKKIMARLSQLDKTLSHPEQPPLSKQPPANLNASIQQSTIAEEIDRLEQMMLMMNQSEGADPEMQQLENTLEKILDIQHPERVKARYHSQLSEMKDEAFAVVKYLDTAGKSFIGGQDSVQNNLKQSNLAFFSVPSTTEKPYANAIRAVIHDEQVLVNGSIVKLRLVDDIYVNGRCIPKSTFLFGEVALEGERLHVNIPLIRYEQSLFPVHLVVHDLDGLPGIYIPGAITREVAKLSADNSLQLMELSTLDPSFKAQATAAGISTAKNLLSRKVRQVKVMVKAGYQVLLKDADQKK